MRTATDHLDVQESDPESRDKMPSKSRRHEQAINAFIESPETDLDLIKSCFWELRNGYTGCSKRMARWFTIAIVLACVFELTNLRLIDKATISFIEITRLNFLMYILPPAVAFTLIQVCAVAIEQYVYEALMVKLAERKLPGLHLSNMDELFLAQAGFSGADIPPLLRGRSESLLYVYNYAQAFLVMIAYILFEIYAYSVLLSHSFSLSISALSLSVTIMLSIVLTLFLSTMFSNA